LFSSCNFKSSGTFKEKQENVNNGFLDLTNFDLKKNKTLDLDGEWFFCPFEYLNPENNYLNDNYQKIKIPGEWNNILHNNKKIGPYGYGTFILKIILPENSNIYGIKFMDIETSYKAYLNGKLISANGNPGTNKKDTVALYKPNLVFFKNEKRENILVIHAANYHNDNKGGICRSLKLGLQQNIIDYNDFRLILHFCVFGAVFLIGIYHFLLFLLRKQEWAYLLFFLYCFLISLRILVTDDFIFFRVFPDFDFDIGLKIGYLTMYTAFPIFSFFIYFIEKNKIIYKISILSSVNFYLLSLIVLIFPSVIYTKTVFYFQITLILFSIALLVMILYFTVINFIRKKENEMFFSAVGCLFLIAFAFNDIIDSKGMIKTGQIFHIGLLIFTVFHSIILSKRYAGTYNQKDFLINELETTLKEKIFYKNYASERTNKEKILLDNFSKLTKREKQIIYLLGIGKLEKEIADILEISQNTVKNLKYLLFKKTNVTNKQELLNIYFDKNIQLELLDISKLK